MLCGHKEEPACSHVNKFLKSNHSTIATKGIRISDAGFLTSETLYYAALNQVALLYCHKRKQVLLLNVWSITAVIHLSLLMVWLRTGYSTSYSCSCLTFQTEER